MINKEERILVLTTHNEDGECECVTRDGCHVDDSCQICNVGMTKQKAIEIMAQAICMSNADGCGRRCLQGNCCYYVEREKEAEAALNALLEGLMKKNLK